MVKDDKKHYCGKMSYPFRLFIIMKGMLENSGRLCEDNKLICKRMRKVWRIERTNYVVFINI